MTTYVNRIDLDTLLDGFVPTYYGSYIDGAETITIGTQYENDLAISFQETNEWLRGINHLKNVPVGTQSDGNYPRAIRLLQGNLMIYTRLKSRHYGEFNEGIPGWINVFLNRAKDLYSDIKNQDLVFDQDYTHGEAGIGVGTYVVHAGSARWYTNWETGVYYGSDFPRSYVFIVDGTGASGAIGASTFKWSKDGGVSFEQNQVLTSTTWLPIEKGLELRWEPVGTTSGQLSMSDRFDVLCVPMNIPVKSGQIRYTTFLRG